MVATASTHASSQHEELDDSLRTPSGRIPSSVVLTKTENLPAEERNLIRRAHAHYWDEDMSLTQLGRAIGGYDGSTMSRIFRGEYGASGAGVLKALEKYLAGIEDRNRSRKTPFIKTDLHQELLDNCELARVYRKIVCIWGESQTGKTTNLREICAGDREGSTFMIEVMPGARESDFIASLCALMRLSTRARQPELLLNIANKLRRVPNLLLIIDEGARAGGVRAYGGGNFRVLEIIRWLADRTQCGVLYCGTNVTRDQLSDATHEKYLNQFNRRCLRKVQLPDIPCRRDLNAFAAHYSLDPATGDARKLEKAVITQHGLGVWLTLFSLAKTRASKDGKATTWDHVIRAHAFVRGSESADRAKLNSKEEV